MPAFVFATVAGLRSADPAARELLASVDASRLEVLWRLRLPSALPSILAAARYAVGLALAAAYYGEGGNLSNAGLGAARPAGGHAQNGPVLWATVLGDGAARRDRAGTSRCSSARLAAVGTCRSDTRALGTLTPATRWITCVRPGDAVSCWPPPSAVRWHTTDTLHQEDPRMRQRARFPVAVVAVAARRLRAADDATRTPPRAMPPTTRGHLPTGSTDAGARPPTPRRWHCTTSPCPPASRLPTAAARPTMTPARSPTSPASTSPPPASIVDVIVADEAGYYDDLCLDVELQPGSRPTTTRSIAAGDAQFASGRFVQRGRRLRRGQRGRLRGRRGRGPHGDRLPDRQAGRRDRLEDLAGHDRSASRARSPPSMAAMLATGRADRRQGLRDGAARRLRPDRPHRARRHRRVPRLQEQRARASSSGRAFRSICSTRPTMAFPGRSASSTRRASSSTTTRRRPQDFVRATMHGLADAMADPEARRPAARAS